MIKLQHLSVIFIAIMLPMSLIISIYVQTQIDTLVLQQQYDASLKKSAYDAIKAFDMNTTGSNVSNVADSLRADIEAAISTFTKSLATSFGVSGYNKEVINPYIPAILFTLYDGYYIYAPTKTATGYEYMLKPYNYYSVRYKNGSNDVVINYTLDNYVVAYGWINGKYQVRSGYLVNDTHTIRATESIVECVPIGTIEGYEKKVKEIAPRNVTLPMYSPLHNTLPDEEFLYERNDLYYIDPECAAKYKQESDSFTTWAKDSINGLGWITPDMAMRNNKKIGGGFSGDNTQIFKISSTNDPEKEDSEFNMHRIDIIQNSIENNLNYAITEYAKQEAETNYNYRLPQLNSEEWLMVASNICMVPFIQGMPVGTRFYNNYTIVKSSTNKFFAEPENIYYIDENDTDPDRSYHRIDCPKLNENSDKIIGFSSYAFQPFFLNVPENDEGSQYLSYWKHPEKACYYCIVSSDYESQFTERDGDGNMIKNIGILSYNKQEAYYTAVARERYRQYRTTDYLGEANKDY